MLSFCYEYFIGNIKVFDNNGTEVTITNMPSTVHGGKLFICQDPVTSKVYALEADDDGTFDAYLIDFNALIANKIGSDAFAEEYGVSFCYIYNGILYRVNGNSSGNCSVCIINLSDYSSLLRNHSLGFYGHDRCVKFIHNNYLFIIPVGATEEYLNRYFRLQIGSTTVEEIEYSGFRLLVSFGVNTPNYTMATYGNHIFFIDGVKLIRFYISSSNQIESFKEIFAGLSDCPISLIGKDYNFNWKIVVSDGLQLLEVHHDRAIPGSTYNRRIRSCCSSDCFRQIISH